MSVKPSLTWNFQSLTASDNDAELTKRTADAQTAVEAFVANWGDRDDYLHQPAILAQALHDYQQLMRDHGFNGWAWYYYELRSAQDETDSSLKAKFNETDELATKMLNQVQPFLISIAAIAPDQQAKFLEHPGLQPFHHYLEMSFAESKYLLSAKEEAILNLMSGPAYSAWVRMTSSILAQESRILELPEGPTEPKTLTQIIALSSDRHKPTRDAAAVAMHQITADHALVATEEMNAILMNKKLTDDLRGLDRPDQSRHISDDIDSSVVDALLQTVSNRNALAHRYYHLKAALLGQSQLAYHERSVEYGHVDQHYTYDQAVALVDQTLHRLDPEFSQIFADFRQQGLIDVYPRQGKSGGAFCAHLLITQPTYILLNHTDRLQDVLTLAHELGHGINNEYVRQHQTALNFGTPMSTAEVASTFMEDFVLQSLVGDVDDQTKLSLLMMKLNDDISSIFRQVAAYQFEQALHTAHRQQGYLDQLAIGKLFSQFMAGYMGPAVEQSEGSQNWWVYWSHFRNFFYVYSYASGLLISKSLQAKVRQDARFIDQVKVFLSAGLSQRPVDIFKQLGLDITQPAFWELGLNQIETDLKQAEALSKQLKLI